MRSGLFRLRCAVLPALALVLTSAAMAVRAQQPVAAATQAAPTQEAPPPMPDAKSYVLHVYQNLLQIPTLVVTAKVTPFGLGQTVTFDPVLGLTANSFHISLDRGERFRPTHMRLQGNDPIHLAILIDVSSHPTIFLPSLGGELQHMVATSLLPQDRVSLYAANCKLLRYKGYMPADSAELSKEVFEMTAGKGQGRQRDSGCHGHDPLFDNIAAVTRDLSRFPGRRVILVVSHGDDAGSTLKWAMVRHFATGSSTSVFGLLGMPEMGSEAYRISRGAEDGFDALCQLTGGLELTAADSNLRETLAKTIDLLRQRYILEFPRPNEGTAGEHNIDVTIPRSMAVIRPAGVMVPLEDPAVANDPTTVPTAPSPATYGKRKPLKTP